MSEHCLPTGTLTGAHQHIISELSEQDQDAFAAFKHSFTELNPPQAQRWKDTLQSANELSNRVRPLAIRLLLGARLNQTQDAGLIKGLYRVYASSDEHCGEFCFALLHAVLDQGPLVDNASLHAMFRPIYREIQYQKTWDAHAQQLFERLSDQPPDLRVIYMLSALAGWQYRLPACLEAMLHQANRLPATSALRYPMARWINYAINTDAENCHHLRGPCRKLYDDIMNQFSQLASTSHGETAQHPNRRPTMLVAFSSFWDYRNAPTWIIFNYLRGMAERMPQLDIHILNTDGRHYPLELFSWIAPSFMNRRAIREEEKAWQADFFRDCPNVHFQYWSDHYPMASISGWESAFPPLMDYVANLSPDLILAVHYELLGQAFRGIIPTVHYPMTTVFTDWLKTDCQIYWGNAPLEEAYAGRELPIPRERIGEQRLGVNPSYGDPHQYSRKELGIAEDATVVISVGTRLEREITPELAQGIAARMQQHSQLVWLLVGTGAEIPALSVMGDNLAQVIVRSFDAHVEAIYPHCDIYLNPPRPGGGFSAAMAMNHHVPVLNVGTASDVGMYLASEFIDSDMAGMLRRLDDWLEDTALRNQVAEQQRERLLTEFSISRAVDTLLPVLNKTLVRFWQEKQRSLPSHIEGLFVSSSSQ